MGWVMAQDWVYLVNDRSPEWGHEGISAGEFFAGHRESGPHQWTLPHRYRSLEVGDRIWVYAAAPLKAFVGLGEVATDQWPADDRWIFEVQWSDDVSKRLAANPVTGVLEKRTQIPRRLTPRELDRLHAAIGPSAPRPVLPRGRVRRLREVVQRQGQRDFRARLLEAYGSRCAVTGTDVPVVLQAAHIEPYDGMPTNVVSNGLLLRADLHDLFDQGLVWVDDNLKISVDESLRETEYGKFHGRRLRLPSDVADHPNLKRLAKHRRGIAGQLS
jgi:HNH endonuclease